MTNLTGRRVMCICVGEGMGYWKRERGMPNASVMIDRGGKNCAAQARVAGN